MSKKCFFCGSSAVIKYGTRGFAQRFQCKTCGRVFNGGMRVKREDLIKNILHDYIEGKQTYKEFGERYHKDPSPIYRIVHDNIRHPIVIPKHKNVVVLMDTTYWGRDFGVVVAKDALRDVVLWHKYIYRHEHWTDYAEGYEYLKKHGFHIKGIIVDGLNGLFKAFDHTPIQMCQVYQQRIIRTYLTSDPDLEASKELLRISKLLTCTDMESFIGIFEEWCAKWKSFLNERSHNLTTGKTRYTHAKLRSAYNSLKKHMPWLWTFYKYPPLGIPNTNNGIESTFTDIKKHTRSHTGLS